MDIKAVSGDITQADAGAIVVNLFEGVQAPAGATGAVDRAMDGAISKLIADGEIKGKKGEITVIHTLGKIPPARVVVAGLGKADRFNAEVVRQVMGAVCRRLRGVGIERPPPFFMAQESAGWTWMSRPRPSQRGACLDCTRSRGT